MPIIYYEFLYYPKQDDGSWKVAQKALTNDKQLREDVENIIGHWGHKEDVIEMKEAPDLETFKQMITKMALGLNELPRVVGLLAVVSYDSIVHYV